MSRSRTVLQCLRVHRSSISPRSSRYIRDVWWVFFAVKYESRKERLQACLTDYCNLFTECNQWKGYAKTAYPERMHSIHRATVVLPIDVEWETTWKKVKNNQMHSNALFKRKSVKTAASQTVSVLLWPSILHGPPHPFCAETLVNSFTAIMMTNERRSFS